MTTVRKLDLARELGVGQSAISAYVARGLPVQHNGLIDREAALRWINQHIQPQIGVNRLKGGAKAGSLLRKRRKRGEHANGHDSGGHDELNPAATRARRDLALAEKIELQNEISRGQLVHVDDVVAQVASNYLIVRNKLLSLPAKLAPHLAAANNPEAMQALLYAKIVEVLTALSSGDDAEDEAA